MIATYLAYYNLKGIRLFGPTLWDTPEFIKAGGSSIEDAIFVSGYYANSQLEHVKDFNYDFNTIFGYRPSVWEANACDSATILQNLIGISRPSRAVLQSQLGSIQEHPGLTGATTFNKNGSVRKSLYVLSVRNSSIVEIVP